jgi:hypothetical protein
MIDQVEKLKQLPPLIQQVCGSCRYYRRYRGYKDSPLWNECQAFSELAKFAWPRCRGHYWEPIPPPVPVLVRFKRWLVG